MPVLLLYYLKGTKDRTRIVLALVFSLLGDALLLGEGVVFFLTGMIAFILAHMNYSFYFLHIAQPNTRSIRILILSFLLFLVLDMLVFLYLKDGLGAFALPVLCYMLFISLMASLAAHTTTAKTIKTIAIQYFLPGAILFVVSDAILAIHLFKLQALPLSLWVMLTYGLAQLLLVMGAKKINEQKI